ncbi:hypothetical protein IJT93_12455 [bacterium]|nr:hypothetical protein [bacterium]
MKYHDILYASDNKFADIMLCSVNSLLQNSGLQNIRLHIVCENFSAAECRRLVDFVKPHAQAELFLYPIEDFGVAIPEWKGGQANNARLFYPQKLAEKFKDIDNLLYLDSDTVICGDLSGLTAYRENILCACLDAGIFDSSKRIKSDKYFNAGVLYINMRKWLDQEITEKIKRFLLSSDQYSLLCPDQDTLNLVLKGQISQLPLRYNLNFESAFFKGLYARLFCLKGRISYQELQEAAADPLICHTYGGNDIKPWHENKINPFNKIFRENMAKVNPDFRLQPLKGHLAFMASHPFIYKNYRILRRYLPDTVFKETFKLIKK